MARLFIVVHVIVRVYLVCVLRVDIEGSLLNLSEKKTAPMSLGEEDAAVAPGEDVAAVAPGEDNS